ncbi:putative reverse transcriptase domain-containing protein [Tanacetum coccineum]
MDLMNRVCKPYLNKFVIVFIDDILIYSKSKEEHEVHLKLTIELLEKKKLFGKNLRCEFWLQERNKVIAYISRELKLHEKNYTTHDLELSAVARILEVKSEASKDSNTLAEMLRGLDKQFKRKDDGRLYFVERIWVPAFGNMRTFIMDEAHATKYIVHPGADKCGPFEALSGRKCRTPIAWDEVGESKLIRPEIVKETTNKIVHIKERLKAS